MVLNEVGAGTSGSVVHFAHLNSVAKKLSEPLIPLFLDNTPAFVWVIHALFRQPMKQLVLQGPLGRGAGRAIAVPLFCLG